MAFQLERDERVLDGIERSAREELRAALAALDPVDGEVGDEAVHEARKRGKRARALLRLVRSGMPKGRRKEEQSRIRDAGREIADLRDARVLLDTLDGMVVGERLLSAEAVAGVRAVLEGRYQAARSQALADGVGVTAAASRLAAAADAPGWELEGGAEVVSAGLERSAARARKAYAKAGQDPTPERLHTWRKRVKDLRHQVEVLVPAWPPVLGALAEELHALSDLLGEHHDLHVLAEVVEGSPEAFASTRHRDALDDVLVHRGEERAAAAFQLGARVHAEDPAAFAGRVAAYLAAWSGANRAAA